MKENFNLCKYNLYLLLHKRIFIYMTMGLTILLCFQSFQSILKVKDAFYIGDASVQNFMMSTDYSRRMIFLAIIYIMPLFVGLSLSDTWYTESKLSTCLFTKCRIKNFILMKAAMTFIAGFLVCFIPFIMNYVCEYIMLGESNATMHSILSVVPDNNITFLKTLYPLYELLKEHPSLFIGFYTMNISLFGGLCSASTFCISLLTKNKVVSYIGCFIFSMGLVLVTNLLPSPFDAYYIQSIINPYSTVQDRLFIVILGYLLVFLLLISGTIMFYLRKVHLIKMVLKNQHKIFIVT